MTEKKKADELFDGSLALDPKHDNKDNIMLEPEIPLEIVEAAKAIGALLEVPTLQRPKTKPYEPLIDLPVVK